MLFRLTVVALAQAFDYATFHLMVAAGGIGNEANPIVSNLFLRLGEPAVVLAKIAVIVLISALALAAFAAGQRGTRWKIVGGLPVALGIAAGLIGGITNAATFLG